MASCTYESNPRDKNLVDKRQLSSEWFARSTLVAKQSHNMLAFLGMECQVERIRFDVTKDRLLAFRSYDKSENPAEKNRPQTLVAAFNIINHVDFDEISNKKDTVSRPWHLRDFIEVDWSRNLVPHIECNGWLQSITNITINNSDNHDPTEPFRVRVKDNYIESTINAVVKPDVAFCNSIGEPDCYPAQYRVKVSFRKIDENNDYEEQHYPDAYPIRYGTTKQGYCLEGDAGCQDVRDLWLYADARENSICDPLKHNISDCFMPMVNLNSQFGFFRTEKNYYNRQEGFAKENRQQLINRWNLWQQSKDENGQLIPIELRNPKKIIYYLNPGFPKDLMLAVNNVEKEWNIAFMNVVAKVKNKCTLQNAITYAKKFNLFKQLKSRGIQEINNSNLKDSCKIIYQSTKNLESHEKFFTGDPAEIEQSFGNILEIRRNDCNEENIASFVAKHNLSTIMSSYGLTKITDDNMERACAVLEWVSTERNYDQVFSWQQIGDLRYSFINAVVKPDGDFLLGYGPFGVDQKSGEIISGNANIYLSAITKQATQSATLLSHLDKVSLEDIARKNIADDADINDFNNYVSDVVSSMTDDSYKSKRESGFQINNFLQASRLRLFSHFAGWPSDKINLIEIFLRPEQEINSLLAMISGAKHEENDRDNISHMIAKEKFYSQRSACFFHGHDDIPFIRLTYQLKEKSFQERVNFIKAQIFEATLKHELGHTFGLRHNFKGAYDALNYSPSFWGVNTNDFRMRDGLSDEELRSSSIMDYHMRFNGDFSGLGLYDYAALLAGYAGKIEIFDTTTEDFVPRSFISNLSLMNYKDLPYLFSGPAAHQKLLNHYQLVKDRYLRGDKTAHMQIESLGLVPKPQNFYQRRLVNVEDLTRQMFASIFWDHAERDIQVPYGFCTDGQVNSNDLACQPFIYGSSASEIIKHAINDYELAQLIETSGAKVLPSNVAAYFNYAYRKVYAPIIKTYQAMYASVHSVRKIYPAVHDLSIAAKLGLDFISRVLQAVEPGTYCKTKSGDYQPQIPEEQCLDPLVVDDVVGRKYGSTFSDGLVGRHKRIGFIYDKILALFALIDDRASISREFGSLRPTEYSIGLYRVFSPQLIDIFASLFTDHWQNLAPTIKIDQGHKIRLVYKDLFSAKVHSNHALGPKIKPSTSAILKDYAILFSMAGLSNPLFDHKLDFAKRAKISLLNNAVLPSDENVSQIIFRDPNTGVGYRALALDKEDLSPGYLLLKDANQFIHDGRDSSNPTGEWFLAKSALALANEKLKQMKNSDEAMTASSNEDLGELENEVARARQVFLQKNRKLNEKVRVIEQVARLSKQFVD